MLERWKYILPFVAVCVHITLAVRSRDVYEYDECRAEYQDPLGLGSGKIPSGAMWASTSSRKSKASDARLNDPLGAWTAFTQNSNQVLGVDLGADYLVTAVATQGRQGTDEFVTEYFLEYSSDRKTWRRYTNEFGIPEVFMGNENGWQVARRTLLYPIVARYLRFNPQRWNMQISMRAEIYGCLFNSYVASFTGSSYLQYDLSRQPVPSESDTLELRFKTSKSDGVLFYASGNQGDYINLEMRRGYLYFRVDLGSTQNSRGGTEVIGGSLLDDHQWHDVVITRTRKSLRVVVDRLVSEVETNGLFYRLDLDKYMYIGGVPYFNQDGIQVKYNFRGCIENVYFNGAKLLMDAQSGESGAIQTEGAVSFACGTTSAIPMTFPDIKSQLKFTNQDSGGPVRVSFDFRAHDENGLLVYHQMDKNGAMVKVFLDKNGFVAYHVVSKSGQVIEDVVRNTDILSPTRSFTDGLWHTFSIYVDRTKVNCTVDRNVKVSLRTMEIDAGSEYLIGGNEGMNGFRGCMRRLEVAAKIVELESLAQENIQGVDIGTCGIRDRCTPNPCEHGGNCTQSWSNFFCKCEGTGYKGEMCHISAYHISCTMYKLYSEQLEGLEEATIDPDGSGPLKPFKVLCEKDDSGQSVTYVDHDSMNWITVNGYQEPGSYVRQLNYVTNLDGLISLIERASSCRQFIEYSCFNSKLLAPPEDTSRHRSWGWWVGRTYQPMYYWGGAAPGSFKCSCGLDEKGCVGASDTCNCDAGQQYQTSDKGYLVHKDYLPVLELHLGDTGTVADSKRGLHRVGQLECVGDDLFDNVVTFRKTDATLEFATFEADNSGDIWFQFRTTATDGVMIHNTGPVDFIEVRLFQGDTMNFRYNVGNGVKILTFKSTGPMNDDSWHTVHVEHNRKQAWMRIDNFMEVFLDEDSDLIRMLDLTDRLVIGASVDDTDGFVGCIRGLRVNGRLLDMKGKVERGETTYGVSVGCHGKCASNPCFHGGTCLEGYSGYTCDCSYTPFRGWMCGREVGVNMQKNFMIRYMFDDEQGLSASDFQHARIGFTTKVPQGILMQMRNEDNTEYISVEMNNDGGIKVAMDVGFERVEVNTPSIDVKFTNGQQHEVVVERSNRGRTIKVQVDNYPPVEETFQISASSDTILDNPKYIFIGSNITGNSAKGFEGCIFRVQVDNIFPLKRAFQDPRPDFIQLLPKGQIREDMCGYEEYTQPPDPIETRPRSGDVINVTYPYIPDEGLTTNERILLGVIMALSFILFVIFVAVVARLRLSGGDYETQEAKGAEFADNPDTAVVYNQTGLPDIAKKQEWFI